jgi:hypothetical protein
VLYWQKTNFVPYCQATTLYLITKRQLCTILLEDYFQTIARRSYWQYCHDTTLHCIARIVYNAPYCQETTVYIIARLVYKVPYYQGTTLIKYLSSIEMSSIIIKVILLYILLMCHPEGQEFLHFCVSATYIGMLFVAIDRIDLVSMAFILYPN